MNRIAWATVVDYYGCCWKDFSSEGLKELYEEDVVLLHQESGRKYIGKDNAIAAMDQRFFMNCDIDSTIISEYRIAPLEDTIYVSYNLEQTSEAYGHFMGYITEQIKLSDDSKKIREITIFTKYKANISE